MTDEHIQEILARYEATTPGPWDYDGMHNEIHAAEPYFLIVSELREHPTEKLLDKFGHIYNPDFDFIAHAHKDIPELLEEIKTGAALVDEIKSDRDRWKARAEAVENALRTLAPCHSCVHKETRSRSENPEEICHECVFDHRDYWVFDEARFAAAK